MPHNVGRPPKIHSSKKELRSAYPSSQSGRKSRELGHGRSKSQAKNEGKNNRNSRQISPENLDKNLLKSVNFQKSYEFNAQNYTIIKNNMFDNKEIQGFISSKINNSKLKNNNFSNDNCIFDIDNTNNSLIYVPKKLQKASVTVRPIPERISIYDGEFNHYGIFAAADIPKNTYLCDIKGTIKYKSNISSIYSFYYNENNDINNSTSNTNNNISEMDDQHENVALNNINSNNLNDNNKTNKKSCFVMDPFIFVHPAQELNSLIVDSREYGNEGRFIRFYCEGSDISQVPNAQLQSIICPEYNEKNANSNNQVEKEKKYKLILAIISSQDIKKGEEIILSTSVTNSERWFGYPCICGDIKEDIKDSEISSSTVHYNSNCILDSLLNDNLKNIKKANYFGNYNSKSFIIDETLSEWIKRITNRQKKNKLTKDVKNKNLLKSRTNNNVKYSKNINNKVEPKKGI